MSDSHPQAATASATSLAPTRVTTIVTDKHTSSTTVISAGAIPGIVIGGLLGVGIIILGISIFFARGNEDEMGGLGTQQADLRRTTKIMRQMSRARWRKI